MIFFFSFRRLVILFAGSDVVCFCNVTLVHQDGIFIMILCHRRKYRFALKIHGSFYLVNDCLMYLVISFCVWNCYVRMNIRSVGQ